MSSSRPPRFLLLQVQGLSMAPALQPGDWLLATRVRNPRRILRGDVILRRLRQGRWLAHRVVDTGDDAIVTRGDAVPGLDSPCPPALVEWRLLAVAREGVWLGQRRGIAALMAAAGFLRPGRLALRLVRLLGRGVLGPLDLSRAHGLVQVGEPGGPVSVVVPFPPPWELLEQLGRLP